MKTVADIFAERGSAPPPHTPESAVAWATGAAAKARAYERAVLESRAYRFKIWQKKVAVLKAHPSNRHRKQGMRALEAFIHLLGY